MKQGENDLNTANSIVKSSASNINREEWVDVAKAIGIILVVLAHAIPKYSYVWVVINQFHMPLFFFLSGYVYRTKNTIKEFIINKILSLWLPFVVASFFVEFIGVVYHLFLFKQVQLNVIDIIKCLFMLNSPRILGAMWFLKVLFFSLICYDIFCRALNFIRVRHADVLRTLVTFYA